MYNHALENVQTIFLMKNQSLISDKIIFIIIVHHFIVSAKLLGLKFGERLREFSPKNARLYQFTTQQRSPWLSAISEVMGSMAISARPMSGMTNRNG